MQYDPKAFWFSKLSVYLNCPKQYELQHILRVSTPQPKQGDLEFGTALHAGLGDILEGGDGVGLFEMYWASLEREDVEYGRYSWAELNTMGPVFLNRFQRLHAKKFKVFKMEERMQVTIDGIDFEGTPDFLGDFEGVPSILDFKTSGYRYDKRKLLCDEQMPGYAAMAKVKYGYEVKQQVYMVFIKDRTNPSIQVIKSELTSMRQSDTVSNMKLTAQTIQSTKEFHRNTRSCIRGTMTCPHFQTCWGKSE